MISTTNSTSAAHKALNTMQDYYPKIIAIMRDYLGPAAERFVNRQMLLSLDKEDSRLDKKDITRLSQGISAALGVLTHRKDIVDEAVGRIKELTK